MQTKTIFIFCAFVFLLTSPAAKEFEKISLAPGQAHEVCLLLETTNELHYAFTASDKLSFNLHYHVGAEVKFAVPEQPISAMKEVLPPPTEARTYCLMWTNKAAQTVDLSLEYQKLAGANK